jgi:His-Xaa-Ser system radical SAM maturase HxsC
MPLRLYGRHLQALGAVSNEPFLVRLTQRAEIPLDQRAEEALLVDRVPASWPLGFRAILVRNGRAGELGDLTVLPPDTYEISAELDYLGEGDLVRIAPAHGAIFALYRRHSPSNSLLVTERCDNYCVMCSQPPKPGDDSWLVDELLAAIPRMSPDTKEIGITGGEPTLLGERFLALLTALKTHLPSTSVHVLSNGRAFASGSMARALAKLRHPDLMIGIPLYAAVAEDHDYVVQARGAYDQTVRGILALKRFGIPVELRFVIHRETYEGLPELARFVAKNLLFVDHVALMGLELMGFARSNLEALWIDPVDYQRELREAVHILDRAGMTVSLYNHQLCTLDEELHRFARSSISDWKRQYFEECQACARREDCGGFFASSERRRSRAIHSL